MDLQRIMIFGRPGSGKSTFAFWLHRKTGIPLHHLDRHFYVENWVERKNEEFLAIQRDIVERDAWIVDGNSIRSLEMRYARADVCLYFNYPKLICLWRILKRMFHRDGAIDDRAEGCKEGVTWKLVRYMWTFEKRVRDQIRELRQKYPGVKFIEIQDDEALRQLKNLEVLHDEHHI